MPTYHTFTSARTSEPDAASLLALLRAGDATIGVQHVVGSPVYTLKRSGDTPWSAPDIATAQTALDTAPAASATLTAQAIIAGWPIDQRALVLALVDQMNAIRAALVPPMAPSSPAQVMTAIVNKAKTLS